jgi:Na+:H+ antiporter, NhaA family
MHQDNAGLPPEIADRFTEPFARFLKIEAAAGITLLLATLAALILSNSAWSTPFLTFWETPIGFQFGSLDFTRSLRHWIKLLCGCIELKR